MSKNKDEKGNLLLELFSEEIPARMQTGSEKQLTNLFEKSLMNRDIGYGPISTFCSPRHLSVIIKNIDLKQKNQIIVLYHFYIHQLYLHYLKSLFRSLVLNHQNLRFVSDLFHLLL